MANYKNLNTRCFCFENLVNLIQLFVEIRTASHIFTGYLNKRYNGSQPVGIIHQVNLGFNKRRNTLPRKRTKILQGNPFSQRIALLRKQESLTMTALAERIGVAASYISLLEAGGSPALSRNCAQNGRGLFWQRKSGPH